MHQTSHSTGAWWTGLEIDHHSAHARLAFEWLLPLMSALLSLVLLTGVLGGLALLVGLSITGNEVVLATVATSVGLAFWMHRLHGRRWLMPWAVMVGAVAVVVLPNLVLGGRVLDDTWDGQWLHQEAVIQLADGWNPFRADLTAEELPNQGGRIRLNGYPKASWLWGASLYRLTLRIERAKAFSLPLMVAAAIAVLVCLLVTTRLRVVVAVPIAIVAAANPVALTQVLNAQQDGVLASLLTIVVAGLVVWICADSRIGLAVATAAAVGAAAIKLTGPVYVAIFVFSGVVWLWRSGKWHRQRCVLGVAVMVAVGALFLLSGGSYRTNLVRHGHPMYPVLGPDSIKIVDAPPHSRFQALTASVLSRSRLTPDDRETVPILQSWGELKRPFTLDRAEFRAFVDPNVRIGGWGPLFGGMTLLAVAILTVAAVRRPRWAAAVILALGPLILSVLVNPYCWKTRYVPQFWIIPLILGVAVLVSRSSRAEKCLAGALLMTAGVNVILVGWAHFPMVVGHSSYLKQRLLDLGQRRQHLELNLEPFRSNRVRLTELGIGFSEVDDPSHSLPVYLGHSPLMITDLTVEAAVGGGGLAAIAWRSTPNVDGYLVEAVVPAPAGPGGSVLTVVRLWTDATEAEIPIPTGPVSILVSNCNGIGCGVGDAEDLVFAGGGERQQPLLGAPHEGEIVRQPSVLFSWLPVVDSAGRPTRYRLSLLDRESNELIVERETADLWIEHRFAEDGSWLVRVSVVGSESDEVSEVSFRTEGVATPRLIDPLSDSSRTEGDVELGWETVAGASSYEYFVAVTGQSEATIRDVTVSTTAVVNLVALEGRSTDYSVIVRACLAPEECRLGSEIGWGPWSHEAGFGAVKLTVTP